MFKMFEKQKVRRLRPGAIDPPDINTPQAKLTHHDSVEYAPMSDNFGLWVVLICGRSKSITRSEKQKKNICQIIYKNIKILRVNLFDIIPISCNCDHPHPLYTMKSMVTVRFWLGQFLETSFLQHNRDYFTVLKFLRNYGRKNIVMKSFVRNVYC